MPAAAAHRPVFLPWPLWRSRDGSSDRPSLAWPLPVAEWAGPVWAVLAASLESQDGPVAAEWVGESRSEAAVPGGAVAAAVAGRPALQALANGEPPEAE